MFKAKVNFLNEVGKTESFNLLVEAETYTDCETMVTEDVSSYLHDFEVSAISHQRIEKVIEDEVGEFFEIKWEFWETDEKPIRKIWYITAENLMSAHVQMVKQLANSTSKVKIIKVEEKTIKEFLKKVEE
jgi:hypothetical protein